LSNRPFTQWCAHQMSCSDPSLVLSKLTSLLKMIFRDQEPVSRSDSLKDFKIPFWLQLWFLLKANRSRREFALNPVNVTFLPSCRQAKYSRIKSPKPSPWNARFNHLGLPVSCCGLFAIAPAAFTKQGNVARSCLSPACESSESLLAFALSFCCPGAAFV